jgi:hypothetical protein
MNEHEIESTASIPSTDDQTWLDATPRGESRKVVYRVGEVRKEFIVASCTSSRSRSRTAWGSSCEVPAHPRHDSEVSRVR